MFRRLFRWLADVPTSTHAFGRRLDNMEDELDAQKVRQENLRGQVLTLSRMIVTLKSRMTSVEDWLEGVDEDELPDYDALEREPPPLLFGSKDDLKIVRPRAS